MAGHTAEVWGSELPDLPVEAPTLERQLCMAHQIRNLQAVDRPFRHLLFGHKPCKSCSALPSISIPTRPVSLEAFQAKLICIERHCDWATPAIPDRSRCQPTAAPATRNIAKSLFVFLYRSDVSPTNNVSERALRLRSFIAR